MERGRQLGRAFANEYLKERVPGWESRIAREPGWFPHELLNELNGRGFFSLWLPKFLGGGGLTPLSYLAMSEELAQTCLGVTNIIGAHYVALSMLSASDNLKLLARMVEDIKAGELTGEPCVFATAVTEPDAGSDLEDWELLGRAAVQTRLLRNGPGYLIHGRKHFISNAPFARRIVVTAFEDLKRPRESASLAVVEAPTKGLSFGAPEKKMGQHLCPAAAIFFDNVVVPPSRLAIASQPEVSRNLMVDVLSFGRIGVAIMAVGAMRAVLRETRVHVRPDWLAHEWCQHELARLSEETEACARLAWSAAVDASVHGFHKAIYNPIFAAADRSGVLRLLKPSSGKRLSQLTEARRAELSGLGSAVKASVTDRAMRLVHDAHLLLGMPAARRPGRLEKMFRDLKLLQIYEGPNLINRLNHFNMSERAVRPGFQAFAEPEPKGGPR